ncbi:AIM24 family protein [Dyella flava]|uniref:AIM24 family protein n=1 Tax=Dyella flava TaxID=1920170 RepID=A0ABS2K132_9GAMM|nr:AIM24 family protein [Dyella flava]MBM7124949.1 AIM24 family protein [Dyella flava]
MKTRLVGTTLPVLEVGLEQGDKLVSAPGRFSWMTRNIVLQTTAQTAGAKGFFGVVGRALSGGGLFMNEYETSGSPGMVAFAANVPGSIVEVQVNPGQTYFIHRHGFMCGTEGVDLSIGFQRSLGAGIFGGEGFILQKLAGNARAWVELGGEIVTYTLAPGETLQVHPGHIGMFEGSVNFEITLLPGLKNKLFGGDGLFIAHLTGPGQVWLQTLTMPNLAHALHPYLGQENARGSSIGGDSAGIGGAIAGGVIGSVLGGLFNKDD